MTAETQARLLRQQIADKARAAVDTAVTVGHTVVANAGRAVRVGSVLAVMAVGAGCDQVFATGPSNPNQTQSSSSGDTRMMSDKCDLDRSATKGPTTVYNCTNWLPASTEKGKGPANLITINQVSSGQIDGSAQYGAHYDQAARTLVGGVSAGSFEITKAGTTQVADGNCTVNITTAAENGQLTVTGVSADCAVPANQIVP